MSTESAFEKPPVLRSPRPEDGAQMWRVARDTGRLDLNSSYLYLLLARDFADTCVVAELQGQLVGFASGYRRPSEPSVIFLWQIGITPQAQGMGLGRLLVKAFLEQPGAVDAEWLETTIAPDNPGSQALFTGMARRLQADCTVTDCFTAEAFPDPGHSAERLYRIGPITAAARKRLTRINE